MTRHEQNRENVAKKRALESPNESSNRREQTLQTRDHGMFPVMLPWQANTDIQYVLNAYACVMYVASYINQLEDDDTDVFPKEPH